MSKRLESSAERRLRTFRRGLTLELYTRRGRFWEMVRWTREYTGTEPGQRMPPSLDPGRVHLPQQLKPVDRERTAAQTQGLQEWMVLLNSLHDAAVPKDLQFDTQRSPSLVFWMGFLSACVLFDPPPDDLLGFADHAVAAYGDFVNPLNPSAEADGDPLMLAPPIRFLVSPDDIEEIVHRRIAKEALRLREIHEHLIELLHGKLARFGVDVRELAYSVEFDWGIHKEAAPTPGLPFRPYIAVDEHTTEADVRNAFRLMAAALPKRPKATKPKREPLLCLQCAIWYDQCGWSQPRIAERMEWAVQRPAGAKARSETVRQYVAEGRVILNQQKRAA